MNATGVNDRQAQEELQLLHQHKDKLIAAAQEALHQPGTENNGRRGPMRLIKKTAQTLVDSLLDNLETVPAAEPLIPLLTELINQGLDPLAALAASEALAETGCHIVQNGADGPSALSARLHQYRRAFIAAYLQAREQTIERGRATDTPDPNLYTSSERYRTLVEYSPDPIVTYDTEGHVTSLNKAFEHLFGWHEAELLGKRIDFVPEDEIPFVTNAIRELVETGQTIGRTKRLTKDGRIIPVEVHANMVYDKEKTAIGSVVVLRDETNRVATEQSLRESQTRLQAILDRLPIGVFVVEAQTGKPEIVNPAAIDLLGRGVDPNRGADDYVEIYQTYLPGTDILYPAQDLPLVKALQSSQRHTGEVDIVQASGRRITVDVVAVPIINENGQMNSAIALFQDISARKQTESILAKQNRELEAVAQISAAASTIQETAQLLQTVVDLTKGYFHLYHAHIYLLNETNDTLTLTTGAGEVGRQMVKEGRTIPLSREQSLVARAARTRQAVIVNDVREEPGFLPHPLLPETRAEMAVPLLVGGRALGVMDIQGDTPGRFTPQDANIMSALASQVGIALQNARSFEQYEQTLSELNSLTRRLTREGWESYLEQSAGELAYAYGSQPEMLAPNTDAVSHSLSKPIAVQGEIIGQLALLEPELGDEDADEIMAAVAERLSTHLESLRLTEQTQQALAQTESLYTGSGRVVRAITVQEVMDALVQSTALSRLDRANIILYDHPWVTEMPNIGTVIAVWEKSGQPPRAPVGTVYQAKQFPSIQFFSADAPTLFSDVTTDKRVDDNLRTLLVDRLGMRSLVVFPFIIGGQWWGFISGQASQPVYLTDEEVRQISSLSDQAATVIQTLRLVEQATVRAEQLAILNEMARDLTIALDVDSALETIHHYTDLLMDARSFYIAFYDNETQAIQFPISMEDGQRVQWRGRPFGNGMTEYVIQSGHGLLIQDGVDRWLEANGVASIGSLAQSWLGMPLKLANILLGVVAVQSKESYRFSQDDYELLSAVANQGSIAIQNARLFEQTQHALAETETLFQVSQKFNAANNPQEIVEAMGEPVKASGVTGVDLYFIETDSQNKPEWIELTAIVQYQGESPIPVGSRFYLPELPISHFWLSQMGEPIFMEDVRQETRLDESARTLLEMSGARSAVYLPLTLAGRWVALIGFRWLEPHAFAPGDKRLYQSMAAQAAVAVNNYQLFAQAQERTRQLEQLTRVETELSQATNEEQIIGTLLDNLNFGEPFVSLSYLLEDDEGKITGLDVVTVWNKGQFIREIPESWANIQMANLPLIQLWQQSPEQIVLINDVTTDPRANAALREQARREGGWQATVLLPLRSGGRWQAILGLTWYEAHPFSPEELFFLERLQEPIAAAIASRRSFVAQQQALAETEALYRASADINASRRYYEIINVLRSHTLGQQPIHNISLNLFDRPWSKGQILPWVEIAERLHETPDIPVGSRFNLAEFPSATLILNQEEPIFISDLAQDPRIDARTKELYHTRLQTHSLIFIPLVAGGQWLGFVDVLYNQPVTFGEVQLRRMLALTGQAAVATQNLRNVEMAQQRAQEAQARREESELLYNLSAQLTAANTLDDVLRIVASPAGETGVRSGILALFSPDGVDDPTMLDVVAGWSPQGHYLITPDTQWQLKEHPYLQFLLRYPRSPLYVHDAEDEIQVPSAAAREFFLNHQTKSLVCLPLNIGRRRLGIILLEWDTPRTFSNTEQRLYHSIAGQASVVVDNRQLLTATQTRAAQLDKLSRIETALSIADTEEEILLAILPSCNNPAGLNIQYIETDRYDHPEALVMKKLWQNGEFIPQSPLLNVRMNIPEDSFLWIDHPNEVVMVEDVETNEQLSPQTRLSFKGFGVRSFATLPLRSSGRWQALVVFHWAEPYTFSPDEQFLWRRLLDALGAVVASRRALLAQQAAREETERLYNASRRLNESTDLNDMLTALVTAVPNPVINRATTMLFEYDDNNEIEAMVLTARWYAGFGHEPSPVGTRYNRDIFSMMPMVISQEPFFISDIQNDPRMDGVTVALLQQLNIKAMALLPLWIGARQIGCVFLQAEEVYEFRAQEIEPYTALAGQLAIAIENQRLLEQTRQQLSDLTAIQQTTSLLTAAPSEDEAIKSLLAQIAKAVGVEVVNLYMLLDEAKLVRAGQYAAIPVPEFPEHQVLNLADYPMTQEAIQTRQPTTRLADDPSLPEQSRQNLSGRTANATIPLVGQDKVLGVLSINSYQPGYSFTTQSVRLLQTMAEQATIALERVRLLEETTRRARREQILREITAKVRGASDVETVMRTAVHEVGRILGRRTFVQLENPDKPRSD